MLNIRHKTKVPRYAVSKSNSVFRISLVLQHPQCYTRNSSALTPSCVKESVSGCHSCLLLPPPRWKLLLLHTEA